MSHLFLIASIESRINAWQKIMESKKKQVAQKGPGVTVTISREFGCEGFPLAERLKALLEEKTGEQWVIFDRALIEEVAKETELSTSEVKNIEERSRLLDIFSSFRPKDFTKGQLFHKTAEYILRVAQIGNAIIVGSGGAIITKNLENCFHFRLVAPFAFRVASISKRLNIEESQAEKFVVENSQRRDSFWSEFFSKDINDPKYFHMIFSNEKVDVETMAKCIFNCVENSVKKIRKL